MPRAAASRIGAMALTLLFLATTSLVQAHRTSPSSGLRSLLKGSDLAVHVRVIGPEEIVVPREGAPKRRSVVRAEVLEVLKGPAAKGETLLFAQHGHGVAEYRKGDEALIFLKGLERSAELSSLGTETSLRWYSAQEEDDDYRLSASSRGATLAAARAYVALATLPREQRADALHRITVKLLASKDRRLAVSALRDLKRSGNTIRITAADVPSLENVIGNRNAPIEVRVGVLAELDRRGLVDGGPRWARLLRTTSGSEQRVVIHAVAAHPSPAADAALTKILVGPDTDSRPEAAVALGHPGNDAAVTPLSKALASTDKRLAMAAIRGLGGVGSPKARAALSSAATSHPEEVVRRRAKAELLRLER